PSAQRTRLPSSGTRSDRAAATPARRRSNLESGTTCPGQVNREAEFSTHLVLPGSVLAIAREFFHAKGRLFTMAVRAEDIRSMEEGLTPAAAENLDAAEEFLRGWIDGRSA
ncbi:MAG: hypothetical protein QGH59_05400, partial [Gemmatimonadota bacterium]|nr:hypothetical protein [Gemmatimonadota bacterium]